MVRRLAAGTGAGSALPRDPNAPGEARSVRKVASSASVLIAAARWAGFPRRAISRRMCGGMMQDNGNRLGCEHMWRAPLRCGRLFEVVAEAEETAADHSDPERVCRVHRRTPDRLSSGGSRDREN